MSDVNEELDRVTARIADLRAEGWQAVRVEWAGPGSPGRDTRTFSVTLESAESIAESRARLEAYREGLAERRRTREEAGG